MKTLLLALFCGLLAVCGGVRAEESAPKPNLAETVLSHGKDLSLTDEQIKQLQDLKTTLAKDNSGAELAVGKILTLRQLSALGEYLKPTPAATADSQDRNKTAAPPAKGQKGRRARRKAAKAGGTDKGDRKKVDSTDEAGTDKNSVDDAAASEEKE